jgi:hypothetical protein
LRLAIAENDDLKKMVKTMFLNGDASRRQDLMSNSDLSGAMHERCD